MFMSTKFYCLFLGFMLFMSCSNNQDIKGIAVDEKPTAKSEAFADLSTDAATHKALEM